MPPRLFILSAPSGTGKTTLAKRLVAQLPHARLSISTTTRPPRGEEVDGQDYQFVDEATFRSQVQAGEFLEWAEVHGHHYGTPRAARFAAADWVVFDIDVQGGVALKALDPSAVTVFIVPPSWEDLEARLRGRRTDSEAVIQRRLLGSWKEIAVGLHAYDHVIVNRVLEQAFQELLRIARGEPEKEKIDRSLLLQAFEAHRPGPISKKD